MEQVAIQDRIPEPIANCWGCGRNNDKGLRIKSYWEGDETVCTWKPKEHHTAGDGILCGGITAALIDCHSLNTAISAAFRVEGREVGTEPLILYLTGSLSVKYMQPVPIDRPVILKAKVKEMKERRMVVVCSVFSDEDECARGEVVAVRFTTAH